MSDCCKLTVPLEDATVRVRMCWPADGESPTYLKDVDADNNPVRLYDDTKPIAVDQ